MPNRAHLMKWASPRPHAGRSGYPHFQYTDKEGARKEALAQLDVMVGRLKEVYDMSEAVATNIQMSPLCTHLFLNLFLTRKPKCAYPVAHPLGVGFQWERTERTHWV